MKKVILSSLLPLCINAKFDFNATAESALETAKENKDTIILGAGIAAIAYLIYDSFNDVQYAEKEMLYISINSDYIASLIGKNELSSAEKTAISDLEESCNRLKYRSSKVSLAENQAFIVKANLVIESVSKLLSSFDMAAIKASLKASKPSSGKFSTLKCDEKEPEAPKFDSGYCQNCDDWFPISSKHSHK